MLQTVGQKLARSFQRPWRAQQKKRASHGASASAGGARWWRASTVWGWTGLVLLAGWVVLGPWPMAMVEGIDGLVRAEPEEPCIRWRPVLPMSNTPGLLKVGSCKVDISDWPRAIPLAGYGKRVMSPNTGIRDRIFIRVVVLDDGRAPIAIVSPELLLVTSRLSQAVAQELSRRGSVWKKDQLYFSATHTHAGPVGYGGLLLEMMCLGQSDQHVVKTLSTKIADAIETAYASRQWAAVASGSEQMPTKWVRNRTKPDDPANRWLDVLVFRQLQGQSAHLQNPTLGLDSQQIQLGKIEATVICFSAHATSRRSRDVRISGDYPGRLMRKVENRLGGNCVFLAAGVGSMAPPNECVPRDQVCDWLGDHLANRVVRMVRGPQGQPDQFRRRVPLAMVRGELRVPSPRMKITQGWCLSPVLCGLLHPASAPLMGLRLGDRILLGTPNDYNGLLAQELRHPVNGASGADGAGGDDPVTVVTSFNGDYVGYVIPARYDPLKKYEPQVMTFHGLRAEPIFQSALRQGRDRLVNGTPPALSKR